MISKCVLIAAAGLTTLVSSSVSISSLPQGGAPCTSDLDCQLNGVCGPNHQCTCVPQWTGVDCSVLNLLPAKVSNGVGSIGSNTSTWGAGIVFDPASNLYVMFHDEISEHCGMGTWGQNSHCILSTSSEAVGPYQRSKVVVDSWCHGSSVARDPASGRFVLNHMSNAAPRPTCTQCQSGVTPANAPTGPCGGGGVAPYSPQAFVASSILEGPYTPTSGFLNGGNCETFFTPNGTVVVACPWGENKSNSSQCTQSAFLTISTSPSLGAALGGQWTHFPLALSPSDVCVNWEDQNIWVDERGYLHTLMHAFRGQNTSYPAPGCRDKGDGVFLPPGCTTLGGHGYSMDGITWHISPTPVYTAVVQYEDGSVENYRARERPHLIVSPTGAPLFFVSAVGDPGKGGNTGVTGADHSFTLVQGIAQ